MNAMDLEGIQKKAIDTLRNGGLLLYPTDTVWGIGCDATREEAVRRIFTLKQRPEHKPFILLVSSQQMLEQYVGPVHPKLDRLLQYHERPLTVVYPQCQHLPEISHGADGSVAIRIVKDAFCKTIIEGLGRPIVSTSANRTGDPFPKHFGEITSDIISGVDYVTPHRQQETEPGEPSVMVKLSEKDELIFLRN